MANSNVLNRQVLSNYHELQANLAEHIAAIKGGHCDTAAVLHQLEAMQRNVTGIGNFLSCVVPNKFYTERKHKTSTIAERVLQIPELLDSILEHGNIFDILNMRQTCHQIQGTIDASPRLQTRLFLRPEGDLTRPVSDHPLWYEDDWKDVVQYQS